MGPVPELNLHHNCTAFIPMEGSSPSLLCIYNNEEVFEDLDMQRALGVGGVQYISEVDGTNCQLGWEV